MTYQTEFAGRPLKVEINSLATQASGSALISYGNTTVLGVATMSKNDIEADFLPLMVDYEEKFYASGKIKGSRYMRREGRPSEEAILVSRMIDRALRPYFPQNLRKEVQVILTVFSFDEKNDPEFPAFLAASLALSISNIPWSGPVAGVRIGINGEEKDQSEFIINPTYEKRENAKLDVFISGRKDSNDEILFNMIDGEAEEIADEKIIEAIKFSESGIKNIFEFQKEIQEKEGKEKLILESSEEDLEKVYKENKDRIKEAMTFKGKEHEGKKNSSSALSEIKTELELSGSFFEKLTDKAFQEMVLEEDKRPDGRKIDELREIKCEAGIFSQTHGSGVFFRGLTHVVSILTLGAPGDELLLEGMETVGKKRFLHHYNFPPYSVGETRFLRGPGRREIGHGALAEKALRTLIPEPKDFPYTIRIVSEIVSSNGSTSMASVCAASLALFDAGVPIKRAVAGISCGLAMEDDDSKPVSERKYKVLTDIQGPEDSCGGMDYKVAGTSIGITAIQLDIKVKGLTLEILQEGTIRAKKTREEILNKMEGIIPKPREELSPFAPCILKVQISPDKIREVIGPGGKIINEIIDKTGAAIDIEDDGLIFITGENRESADKAVDWVKRITKEVEVGEVIEGKIKNITDFGLFVEVAPNQDGLLHVSEISPDMKQGRDLNNSFKLDQILSVKVKNIDRGGKISLSLKK